MPHPHATYCIICLNKLPLFIIFKEIAHIVTNLSQFLVLILMEFYAYISIILIDNNIINNLI